MGKANKIKIRPGLIKLYWPLLAIVLVWLAFSYPYIIKGLIPFPSSYLVDFFPPWNNFFGIPVKNNAMPDIITQIFPWKKLVVDSWKSGQIPKWNPYQFAGNPLLANYQSAAFTPLNILFFILPFIDAWSILVLLQPLLAGLFMYIFTRELNISKAGSFIASVSFMFSGFIVVWMAYGTLSYAIVYLPLLLYGLERFFKKPSIISSIIIAFSIPLSFFSGHFQTSFYFLSVGMLYLLSKLITKKNIRLFISAFVLIGIGLAFSLPQILPSIELYQQSVRSALFQSGEVIPINYIITVIAPDFFGNPVTRNDWFGHYAEWASFAGVAVFILALLSLYSIKKRKAIAFFALLSIMSIVSAYSKSVNTLLVSFKIPVLSTSAASRVIALFSFSLAVLSGFGLDVLVAFWKSKERMKNVLVVLTIVTLFIAVTWLFLFHGNLMFVTNIDAEKLHVAKRNFLLPTALVFFTGVLLMAGFNKSGLVRKTVVASLCLIVVFDMLRFSTKWMPFDSREYVYPALSVLEYLKVRAGNNRVFGNIGNEGLAPFRLQGVEGYDPLYIERYGELVRTAYDGKLRDAERSVAKIDRNGLYTKTLLDLLGTRYVLHSKGDKREGWAFPFWKYPESFGSAVYSDDKYEIYENTKAFPRAFVVYDYIVKSDDQEIIDAMYSESTDLRNTVVLEQEPFNRLETCDAGEEDEVPVNIYEYTATKIKMKVTAYCDGLLFLSDNYYSGWKAFVNDRESAIYRADYSFRAVEVPKGESTVIFTL